MAAKDGMFYAAKGKPDPVVNPGEFVFSAVGLDHGHIYGMTSGLLDAGATLKYVYDPDPQKVEAYRKAYPQAIAAESEEQVLADPETKLVAGACVTSERAALGIRVMQAGKDYFTDKAPLTTLEQLEDVKRTIAETGRKYMVNYSERLQVEAAVYAGELVQAGAIGKVVQVIGMGPHRLNAPSRPAWFFEKEKYGGILCDIGSHQIEQFLFYTGAKDAKVVHSKIANYNHPDTPELDDFGDATLVADNGATGYFRVDWFTPTGSPPGATAAPSSWAPMATSSCASTWTWPAAPRRTTSSGRTRRASTTSTPRARLASPSSGSWCWTASTARKTP